MVIVIKIITNREESTRTIKRTIIIKNKNNYKNNYYSSIQCILTQDRFF